MRLDVINCRHHTGGDSCEIGLAAREACFRACDRREPIVPDTPGHWPTIPPVPFPATLPTPRVTPTPPRPIPVRASRPPEPIPDDFDPDVELARMKQGGCCGRASRG